MVSFRENEETYEDPYGTEISGETFGFGQTVEFSDRLASVILERLISIRRVQNSREGSVS